MREILATTEFSNLKPDTANLRANGATNSQFVDFIEIPQKSVMILFFCAVLPSIAEAARGRRERTNISDRREDIRAPFLIR